MKPIKFLWKKDDKIPEGYYDATDDILLILLMLAALLIGFLVFW